jgi:hypothetical protein
VICVLEARSAVYSKRRAELISHALTIIANEMNRYLELYNLNGTGSQNNAFRVELGNLSEGLDNSHGVTKEKFYLSVINIQEEKTLKNIPNYIRDDKKLKTVYENPPVYLNFMILMTSTHSNYADALKVLSRVIRFFQSKNVFTQDDVAPDSITNMMPVNVLDQLDTFKLIFDLYSPSLEEVNHLWGTLGGKQYPFVLYIMRMLDLKFKSIQSERGLITEVISDFHHKKTATG